MSLYQFMVNRYVNPVIERHRAEGRAEGRDEERVQWRQWLERRNDAEAQGLPFDEPPPDAKPDDQEIC